MDSLFDIVPDGPLGLNITPFEASLGNYAPDHYGWLLDNPVLYENPVPSKWKGYVEYNNSTTIKVTHHD